MRAHEEKVELLIPPTRRVSGTTISRCGRGLTLVEILVVLVITGIVAAVLAPVLVRARERARQAMCASNMRRLGAAVLMFAKDHHGWYPSANTWADQLAPYLDNRDIMHCPSGRKGLASYALNQALAPGSPKKVASRSDVIMLYETDAVDALVIKASGTWRSGAWAGGPNGQPSQPPTSGAFLLPHSIPYALIGKIGDGPAFFIGEHYAGSPSGQGALMLSMNDAPPYADIDPYGDNEGSLTVRVTAAPNPPLTFQVPAMSPWSRDTGVYLSTSTGSTSPVFGQIANRHRSGSNICFADGHVKWLATADAPKHDSRFENVTFDAPAASDAASATVEMDGRKWLVLCDSKAGDFADWRTSEPSRFYFDRAVGAYHYLIADGAEDYAFVPVAYHGRSFRLEFDVLPIRTDPRANFRLGVWDLKMRQVTPSCLYTDYFLDDNGYHVYLNGYWPGGSADTRPCAYADGQWYHTIVEYSATGREAVVTVRGTRDRQTFSATVTGIGDLSACNRIAMTSIGDGVCRGRIAVGYVKNVKLLEELGKTRD